MIFYNDKEGVFLEIKEGKLERINNDEVSGILFHYKGKKPLKSFKKVSEETYIIEKEPPEIDFTEDIKSKIKSPFM